MPIIPFVLASGLAALVGSLVLLLLGLKSKGPDREVIEGIEMDDPDQEIGALEQPNRVMISSEEIPLDNRQGSDTLVSEHSFRCAATSKLSVDRETDSGVFLEQGLIKIVEAGLSHSLEKGMGLAVGHEEERSLRLRFSVAPGAMSRYRITWKQEQRHGRLVLNQDGKRLKLPFTVTHGLTHEVEALPA
ncbi:hypothetical protein [Magnetospira sp. QH-2]|uniref:hypothetical protein n=1 Tax=Magnetospira sp. (strain QH-2) TaxID=1288970 RepID=UPI0003E81BA1|nr:hypothetical protein [Magnetospira sp. QH-2]CCQ74673.1 protein of unknown function [Magnetospira sp. QH-2]